MKQMKFKIVPGDGARVSLSCRAIYRTRLALLAMWGFSSVAYIYFFLFSLL
jgi:hypothetical protein